MSLPVIHAATHDSVGMGEDGPTHQPLELGALFRAMPKLLFFRPADAEEVAGSWIIALRRKDCPSIISASRHAVRQFAGRTDRACVEKGAYVLDEAPPRSKADLTLLGCGAELEIAAAAADILREQHGRVVRLVSVPCFRLFEDQRRSYKREVLRRQDGIPAVAVEAYVGVGWERYADAACVMSTKRFGVSAPGKVAYKYFGFTEDSIADRVEGYLKRLAKGPDAEDGYALGEWAEL
jgi:dihydroxyacetone synthase